MAAKAAKAATVACVEKRAPDASAAGVEAQVEALIGGCRGSGQTPIRRIT